MMHQGNLVRPVRKSCPQFRDDLDEFLGQPVVRRYSGGADVHAACGMLAGVVNTKS